MKQAQAKGKPERKARTNNTSGLQDFDIKSLSHLQREILQDVAHALKGDATKRKHDRFFNGDFSTGELKAVGGIDFMYAVIVALSALSEQRERMYKMLSALDDKRWSDNEDLAAIACARSLGIGCQIEGEHFDAVLRWYKEYCKIMRFTPEGEAKEDADELSRAAKERALKAISQTPKGIYTKIKIARRKEPNPERFDRSLAALTDAAETDPRMIKARQRQIAAQYIIDENEAGRHTSIDDGALQFSNMINAASQKTGYNGYKNYSSLGRGLYKFAKPLGIEKFRTSKRGRKRKE